MRLGHAALAVIAASLVVLLLVPACAEEESGGDSPAAEEDATTEDEGGGEEEDSGDTGRMSETEFEMFSSHDAKLADELQAWSSGYATCATIGQTGDLAGFRECVDEEWDGVEDAALVAYSNAEDTYDDVAKTCLKRLKGYATQVDRVYSQNLHAYETAQSLNFEAIVQAFSPLARVAGRYAKLSVATHAACEPK